MYKSVKDNIAERIAKGGKGRVILIQDMEKVADYESVKKAFQRLTKEGMLIRMAHGIYWYPKIETELGTLSIANNPISVEILPRIHVKIKTNSNFYLIGLSYLIVGVI